MSELLARKTLRASSLVTMTLFGMVLVSLGLQRQALAQGTDMSAEDAKQYQDCLKLARLKPEDGFESAIAWRDMGGGEPAKHCVAVALIALEKYEEAATRLDALADESTSPTGCRRAFGPSRTKLDDGGKSGICLARPVPRTWHC